uniref:Mitochondrial calcium uniporter regulator 1 n=1 Tax=Xenopus tropicalis TaxID=8364 RepID=A0A6I8R9A9_XENTR
MSRLQLRFLLRRALSGSGCPRYSLPGSGCPGCFLPRVTCFRDFNIITSTMQYNLDKRNIYTSVGKHYFFDTHAVVQLLEANGFSAEQSEIVVSALVKILNVNMNLIHKDMVTKEQQEISLQQVMSLIASVKKDMIILEKSEFSALRTQNEKVKIELQQLKKQLNHADNERKLLELRTSIVELHSQQDRGLTQTKRKIDTEVSGVKTMQESHKLDTIKYLAGSVFTCLTIALGFYRLWI